MEPEVKQGAVISGELPLAVASDGDAEGDERLDEERPAKRQRSELTCADNGEKLRGMEFFQSIGSPRFICAPMVDQSELAFRMLTRTYGVELAYTPMFHSRLFSEDAKYRKRQFTTCPQDRPLFVQFCGDDPEVLVSAAKHVEDQCDAVDINCGCPQGIARKGHYGAFLLSEGDLLTNIARRMDRELKVPVTFKIRLLSKDDRDQRLQETLNLASSLQAAGCSVITLHGRTKEMKGQMVRECDWDAIRAMKQRLHIPVFANGGIENLADAQRCLDVTGANAVMSSEALLETPSLFSGRQILQDQLVEEYLQKVKIYETDRKCVKAHLFRFLYAGLQHHVDFRAQLGASKSLEDIEAAAAGLRARRVEERSRGDFSWPDSGWYRRYRNPLGGKAAEKDKKEVSIATVECSEKEALKPVEEEQ